MTNRHRFAALVLVATVLSGGFAPRAAQASTSGRSAASRSKRVELARKLNTLKASDAELERAVKVLDGQVGAQAAATQSAEQAVAAAEAMRRDADARLRDAEAETARLRGALMQRALEEYKRPQQALLDRLGHPVSLAELSRRTALLKVVANVDRDALDRLHAAREDLLVDRTKADRARELAASRRQVVSAHVASLMRDRADKAKLSSALSARIKDLQSEIDALAADDASLSGLLSQRGLSIYNGKVSSAGIAWPLQGTLTSGFGYRWGRLHAGIDIAAPRGTPIHAAKAGTVIFAGTMSGYGNIIVIDHGGGLSTRYAHQSRLGAREGQHVVRGQVIGFVGSTGHSTGNHCHFETRVNGQPVNPRRFLP